MTIRNSSVSLRDKDEAIEELMDSISRNGILQPLVVRPSKQSYEVIAGNRRLTAAKRLGLRFVPVILRELDDRESFEIALTENLQRHSLTPIEEARAFYSYVGPRKKNCLGYGKVSELARKIGKSQEYISNRIGLLRLPEVLLRELFMQKSFTVSHAEQLSLLSSTPDLVQSLSKLILARKLTVRELEKAVVLVRSGMDPEMAVDLSKLETQLNVPDEAVRLSEDKMDIMMKRTKLVLSSALSYVDDVASEIEVDSELYGEWVRGVRLKVHDAITGLIACQKLCARERKLS